MFLKSKLVYVTLLLLLFFGMSSCGILKKDCDCPSFSETKKPDEKHV